MKLWIVFQLFAFILFIFVPAIAVMMFAALVIGGTGWFIALGLPALLANGIFVWRQPVRGVVARRLDAIARG